MLLADLHVHTTYSDGQLSLSEVVDFYGQRGFDVIAITDHLCESSTFLGIAANYLQKTLTEESFPGYLEHIKEEALRAWDQYQMMVLPGIEISKNTLSHHRSAHLLVVGLNEFYPAEWDIYDIASRAKDQGALTIAAHPLPTGGFELQTLHMWDRRQELSPVIDAWEVASGNHWFEEVKKSGLPLIANSDFHRPQHINSWKTVIDSEKHVGAIFQAVRDQELGLKLYRDRSYA